MGARLRMPLEDSLASGRLSKPRRWLKLSGRADRGWGGTQTESDLSPAKFISYINFLFTHLYN